MNCVELAKVCVSASLYAFRQCSSTCKCVMALRGDCQACNAWLKYEFANMCNNHIKDNMAMCH